MALIISLPQEILILIAQNLEKEDWKNLILVSKAFRYAANRFIWKQVEIFNIEKLEGLLTLFQDQPVCGRNVKKLDITFCQDEDEERRLLFIPQERFIQFIKSVPRLQELIVRDPGHIQFTAYEIEKKGYDSLFPRLTSFTYGEPSCPGDVDSLAGFLLITSNITSLEYYLQLDQDDDTVPLSICCSNLKSITSTVTDFFLESGTTFLPQTSWAGLEKLVMIGDTYHFLQIMDLIRDCSSTLVSIDVGDQMEVDYVHFKPLLPLLKKLEVCNMNISFVPVDFLALIPTTMIMFGGCIRPQHLHHLHLHPRPSLKLLTIRFVKWESGIIEFLPQSISNICIEFLEEEEEEDGNFDEMIEEINTFGRKNLREITVYRFPSRADSGEEEKVDIIESLMLLGITLDVMNWD